MWIRRVGRVLGWVRVVWPLGRLGFLGGGSGGLGEADDQVAGTAFAAEELTPRRWIRLGVVLLDAIQLLAVLHLRVLLKILLQGNGHCHGSEERQAQEEYQFGAHGEEGVRFELIDRWHQLRFYTCHIRQKKCKRQPFKLLPININPVLKSFQMIFW